MNRIIVWYSHGAASAVAVYYALKKYPPHLVMPVYCNTAESEHSDNARFRSDCESWWGKPVTVVSSKDFATIDEVFEKTKYMAGPRGARCTTELKKIPRFKFQTPDDTHIFGFTVDKKEQKRIKLFEENNFELKLDWILRDAGVTKKRCYQILQENGIRLPEMYLLGYRNNNCLGCVKSSSPGYWEKIYYDFPEVFHRRAKQGRGLGVRLIEFSSPKDLPEYAVRESIVVNKKGKIRVFLDTLEALIKDGFHFPYKGEDLSCGPECGGNKV